MRPLHLADRFGRALWPAPPAPTDEAWVGEVLPAEEVLLFRRLPNHDRRHAVRVARTVADRLGPDPEPRWVEAALLHDVGKYDAGLSVVGRAFATLAASAARPARVGTWVGRPGWRGRVAAYAHHGEIGEREILAVGGDPAVASWSRAHHHPETWPALAIPPEVVAVLDAADTRY